MFQCFIKKDLSLITNQNTNLDIQLLTSYYLLPMRFINFWWKLRKSFFRHIEGLLYKVKENGISRNLPNIVMNFLYQQQQKRCSTWEIFFMGRSWNRSLTRFHTWTIVFLIYINDLSDDLASNPKFADDIFLFSAVKIRTSYSMT